MSTDTMTLRSYSFHNDLARLERSLGPVRLDAWRVLLGRPLARLGAASADTDDVVQDLLAGLVALCSRVSETWRRLRAVPEEQLRTWLRERARWAWLDRLPGGPAHRALRSLVRQALKAGLPPAGPPPASLRQGGRFSLPLVARAVAWAVATSVEPLRGAGRIAAALARHWHWELEPAEAAPEEWPPPPSVDVRRAAERVAAGLDPLDRRLLAAWGERMTFRVAGAHCGVGAATAYRHVAAAVALLSGVAQSEPELLGEALDHLLRCCSGAQD